MKFLILILMAVGAALLSIWALPMLTEGLVVVRFAGWYVELRIITAIALIILLCLALWLVVWLWRLPGNAVRGWVEKRAQAQLELGMLALSEGDFTKAEKALSKSAQHSKTPALNYLAAAQAAQGKGQSDSRDKYLDQADLSPRAHRPVQLTRAELLIASGDLDSARELLEDLDRQKSNQPRVLGLMVRCYRNAEDWQALATLAPRLRKAQVVDEETASDLERRGYEHSLSTAENASELTQRWSDLPKAMRNSVPMLATYGRAAQALEQGAEVEEMLRKVLRKNWSDELADVWVDLPSPTPEKRRKQLNNWLKDKADSALVQYAMGQDYADRGEWSSAINHLENSLKLEPTPRASEALGLAAEHNGNIAEAARAYKQALALAAGREPEPLQLPQLALDDSDEPSASETDDVEDADFEGEDADSGVDAKQDEKAPDVSENHADR